MTNTRRSFLVAAFSLAGCATPKSPAPSMAVTPASLTPDATTSREVALLLSTLDARAMQRRGFSARYHVEAGNSEQTIRFAYLAPNRARIDVRAAGGTFTSCVDETGMSLRAEGDGTIRVARFESKELEELWSGCAAALEMAFPSTETLPGPPSESEGGPIFEFGIRPDPRSSDHGSFSVSVSWLSARRSFLSWLAPREWDRARYVDPQVIEVSNGTATATLSTATGLILDMRAGEHFHATLVDSTDDVDPSEFTGWTAATKSDDSQQWFASRMWAQQRWTIYQRILRDSRLQDADLDQFRHRVEPVFEVLHRTIVKHHYRDWQKGYTTNLEKFFDEYDAALTEIGSDPTEREECDDSVADSCLEIEKSLDSLRDEYVANLAFSPVDDEDSKMLTKMLSIECDAARAAFHAENIDPILRHIDERLKAIRAAH